jgi:hypothetical protein
MLMQPKAKGSPAKLFLFREARKQVRKAGGVTLAACRHGGLTELGHTDLTEQSVLALVKSQRRTGSQALRQAHRSSANDSSPEASSLG